MSEVPAAKPKASLLRWALWGAGAFGVAAVVYIIAQAVSNPTSGGDLKALARGDMGKLTIPAEAGVAPVASLTGPDGKPLRLGDFRGKVVVVNLWATWCGPCVIEMPTLARLAQAYQGKPLEVVAISIDRGDDVDKARQFIARHAPLKFYHDPTMKLPFALTPPALGMPTTIIYGADGVEKGRLSGGADWSGADAKALLDKVLAES
jgi:thiol-disulfide isomerase/thioredoxin